MGIRELRQRASELKIKNYGKMNKPQLEMAIAEVERNDTSIPVLEGQKVGEVNGRVIFVSKSDDQQSMAVMLGTFSKGDARKVRRMLSAAGYKRFASVPRLAHQGLPARKAA